MISTENAPAAVGPYSQAVVANGHIYVSGQIAPAAGDIAAQTKQVCLQLQSVLQAAGSDLSKVLKTTVYMKDLSQFTVMNEVYGQFFAQPFPARATVQVVALPKDALVEIDCVATV